jgi:PAS domain S-box-containing protein
MTNPQTSAWTLGDAIIAHMPEAVIYATRDGCIKRWNPGATAVFGFSADEAIGQRLDLIIPEPLRAAHWRGFHAAIRGGALTLDGRATLTRGLHKSGNKLYVEMSFALVRDAAHAVQGSVAVARDVTQRVLRERAARTDTATDPVRVPAP